MNDDQHACTWEWEWEYGGGWDCWERGRWKNGNEQVVGNKYCYRAVSVAIS